MTMEPEDQGRSANGAVLRWPLIVGLAILLVSPWPVLAMTIKRSVSGDIIAVPATAPTLDSQISPIFSRSPYFIIVDLKKNTAKVVPNEFKDEKHAVGLRIAHRLLDDEVGVVLASNIGPEPYRHLSVRDVRVYSAEATTARDAVRSFRASQLPSIAGPNVPIHHGLEQLGKAPPGQTEPCPFPNPQPATPAVGTMPNPNALTPTVRQPAWPNAYPTAGGTPPRSRYF
jgi:predicted Fe-Mo cluster-binding NifX family protein